MYSMNAIPWTIRSDTPRELLFLGYIAIAEDFHVPEAAPPTTPLEGDWQAWWQFMLTHTFDTIALAVGREHPSLTEFSYAREIAMRHMAVYDPPTFAVLADRPALQALCRQYWPDYHREWETVGGSGLRLIDDMSRRFHDLHVQDIVQESVRSTGKRLVPFTLSFDFLYWPENYANHLSPTHVVLGRHYLEALEELRLIMRAAIISALA